MRACMYVCMYMQICGRLESTLVITEMSLIVASGYKLRNRSDCEIDGLDNISLNLANSSLAAA